jgi:hypothetical protein
MKPTKENLPLVSKESRIKMFVEELEKKVVSSSGETFQDILSSMLQNDKSIFAYNTGNYIEKEILDRVAERRSIPKARVTRTYNFLRYMGEHMINGEPTDEVVAHVYHEACRMQRRNYGYRDFGKKSLELIEEYLQEQNLLPKRGESNDK